MNINYAVTTNNVKFDCDAFKRIISEKKHEFILCQFYFIPLNKYINICSAQNNIDKSYTIKWNLRAFGGDFGSRTQFAGSYPLYKINSISEYENILNYFNNFLKELKDLISTSELYSSITNNRIFKYSEYSAVERVSKDKLGLYSFSIPDIIENNPYTIELNFKDSYRDENNNEGCFRVTITNSKIRNIYGYSLIEFPFLENDYSWWKEFPDCVKKKFYKECISEKERLEKEISERENDLGTVDKILDQIPNEDKLIFEIL